MKPAFLFPGQGSQSVGMGRDLFNNFPAARATFEEADDALGFPLSKIIFDGPDDTLKLTEHTQPAILTVSVAAARILQEKLGDLQPAFAAGHSLGEYSAHVIAGTFPFADAVRIVRNRGRYMQDAVPAGEGAMAAILGLPSDQINDLCGQAMDELATEIGREIATQVQTGIDDAPSTADPAETRADASADAHADAPLADSASARSVTSDATVNPVSVAHAATSTGSVVSPANLNSPDQTVISGALAAVTRAAELCKAAGAKRTVMLQVSAPFHCSLMKPAQERLSTDLESIAFEDPAYPILANVDARAITRSADARDCLIRQVTAPVRWVECIQILIADGATHFLEIGPGRVLSGLLRQIDRAQTALNVEDTASLEKTLAALAL